MAKKQKPTEKFETAIIVGPMPFPQKCIQASRQGQLIFVDGGMIHKGKFQKKAPGLLKNSFTLGDGDGPQKSRLNFKKNEQDLSDLAFCLQKMQKERGLKNIILLGFLGGRRDHELFNLGEVALFLKQKNNVRVYFEDKIEFLPAGTHRVHFHGTFSLGSLFPNKIKISGECLYPLLKWTKIEPLSSLCLSNEAHGDFSIECKEALMLIYSERSRR